MSSGTKVDDVERLLSGDYAPCDACGELVLKKTLEEQWTVAMKSEPRKLRAWHCEVCSNSWAAVRTWDTQAIYDGWKATRRRS
jgi:hypothetical protein